MSRKASGLTKISPNVGRKSKLSVQMSPTKKLSKTISKGDLSASDALKIMQEIGSLDWKQEQEALLELERKNNPLDDDNIVTSPINKEIETDSVDEEEFEDVNDLEGNESSNGEMTKKQIERESRKLLKAEKDLEELRIKMEEKEIIFHKLLLELKRMSYIFNKVKEIDIRTAGKEFEKEESKVIF